MLLNLSSTQWVHNTMLSPKPRSDPMHSLSTTLTAVESILVRETITKTKESRKYNGPSLIIPRYYAIVSAVELACWSRAQTIQIEEYEILYHVKTVILYSFPYVTNGVEVAVTGGNIKGSLALAPAMLPFATSLKKDLTVSLYNVWV